MFKLFIIINCLIVSVLSIGPIGYDLFRRIERIPELVTGVQSKQFSSFDRKGLNGDSGNVLRTLRNGQSVLAEHVGAGEINSIWMTRDNGVFTKTGNIHIVLDGVEVLNAKLQNVLDGKLGAPFVWPLVGNGDDTSGGGVIKVPMPYKKSMRITTDTNPNYYHVNYRQFSDSTQVKTFIKSDQANDVIEKLRQFGMNIPKPTSNQNVNYEQGKIFISNGKEQTIFESNMEQNEDYIWVVKSLKLNVPDYARASPSIDDGRAFGQGGWSQFVARVDPTNTGVRIIRKLDSNILRQKAKIVVDGTSVGAWDSSNFTQKNVWGEEIFELPEQLTSYKTHITVQQLFDSSSLDFNEFQYEIQSLVNNNWTRSDVLDLGPNHPGEESAHQYKINGQTWSGVRTFRFPTDQKLVQKTNEFLTKTRIRLTFDGRMTTDVPFGQFFGAGLGMYDTRSYWFSVDALTGSFSSYWRMLYRKEVNVAILSPKSSDVTELGYEVAYTSYRVNKGSQELLNIPYFYATYNEETTRPGHDYIFLNVTNSTGMLYGVSHTMKGLIKTGNIRDYLEGDERVFIDGSRSPQVYGTGTEDFYESGWYFRNGVTFDMPFNGNSGHKEHDFDCENDCTQALRLYTAPIPFSSSLLFGIEHGPVDNNEPAIYSSVAYWYAQPGATLKLVDTISLHNNKDRVAHIYMTSAESTYNMSSSYEGENYKNIITSSVKSTSKSIRFNVKINKDNKGVRISRTSDQKVAYQCVDVYVRDNLVGRWLQPLGNQYSRFLDDTFELSPSVTQGLSELNIKFVPVSHDGGPVLWTAINYDIYNFV